MAASMWTLESPNGVNNVTVELDENGKLFYSVLKGSEETIRRTELGIALSDIDFSNGGLAIKGLDSRSIDESYSLPGGGKRKVYRNCCKELTLDFVKDTRTLSLIVRAYDDGAAYRFVVDGNGTATIVAETGGFAIPSGSKGWAMNFVNHYEGTYDVRSYDELVSDSGDYSMPLLIELPSGRYALFTEGNVNGSYCASHLHSSISGLLNIAWAEDQAGPVTTEYPAATPWRLAIIVDDLDSLINSTIVYDLNPPSQLQDTSWIKGGRAAWNWWADMPNTLETGKRLVDFAASMNWEYVLMDAGWSEEWISELVKYASNKGIGILVWEHHTKLDTSEKVDSILPRWASYGIKGVKVDFFDSDSQARMQEYDRITKKTAELKLLTNYHGATKPTGEERTWPHILTREGILGAEYYKWSSGATSTHNCTVPFTRNAVGCMDYTPVTYSKNGGQTTWAHQTALAVIFESHIQHLADHPDEYEKSAAKEFLKHVAVGWDETRLLEGKVGEYVSIARRNAAEWLIGAICSNEPRVAEFDLSFLGNGSYKADIYKDGSTDDAIDFEKCTVTRGTKLSVLLRANGGCCVLIR